MKGGWRFVDQSGKFVLRDPHKTSYLYFPLVNEAGMMSVITPTLHGDIKTGQNSFLTRPSRWRICTTRARRATFGCMARVWEHGRRPATLRHRLRRAMMEQVTLEAGSLWHKVTRESAQFGLRAEITNFVPPSEDQVELMQVTLTNMTDRPLTLTPTAAIPIYGRSADNLRDHRHVTSLLHRIATHPYGVLVRPTLSFDERGHHPNSVTYGVLGAEQDGTPPQGFCPIVRRVHWRRRLPRMARSGCQAVGTFYPAGCTFEGYEAIGALRFGETILQPGQSKAYVVIMAVMREGIDPDGLVKAYGSQAKFADWFQRNEAHWQSKLETLAFYTGDSQLNPWLRWVALQPILRRLFGNSFLPYHDYGRGGRGWRDLWQDCLALLMMEPDQVSQLIIQQLRRRSNRWQQRDDHRLPARRVCGRPQQHCTHLDGSRRVAFLDHPALH